MARHKKIRLRLFVGVCVAGCAGQTGGHKGDPAEPLVATAPVALSAQVRLPLQRLTRSQVDRTLRDLLGDHGQASAATTPDAVGDSGFLQPGSVGSLEARGLLRIAEDVAVRVRPRVRALTGGCDPAPGRAAETACARQMVEHFGRRAFRRPLAPVEIDDLAGVWVALRADLASFDETTAGLVGVMLQSPSFLYRWDLDPRTPIGRNPPARVAIGPHALASRLSYFLWGSMPDAELFAAADAGRLGTPAEVATQARRMLASDRAKAGLYDFHAQWLMVRDLPGLRKDVFTYPGWSPALALSMATETRSFIEEVLFQGDGRLDTLLTASFGHLDGRLAKHYAVPGDVVGVERRALDAGQRFGLLTQAGLLASFSGFSGSDPIRRGQLLRERIMCQNVPPRPPELDVRLPVVDPKHPVSMRERLEEHRTAPSCRGCHALFDPLGLAFENYDGMGGWRSNEPQVKQPIDPSGILTGVGRTELPFSGPKQLVELLAGSDEVRGCVVTQWFRYATGRIEGPEDRWSLERASAAFAEAEYDVRELLVALVSTPSFMERTRGVGEP